MLIYKRLRTRSIGVRRVIALGEKMGLMWIAGGAVVGSVSLLRIEGMK
jgi:hypothetical protein